VRGGGASPPGMSTPATPVASDSASQALTTCLPGGRHVGAWPPPYGPTKPRLVTSDETHLARLSPTLADRHERKRSMTLLVRSPTAIWGVQALPTCLDALASSPWAAFGHESSATGGSGGAPSTVGCAVPWFTLVRPCSRRFTLANAVARTPRTCDDLWVGTPPEVAFSPQRPAAAH